MLWRFPETVVLTPIDSEAVLLNTANGNSYVLNSLGVVLAALITEGKDAAEIIQQLSEHFPNEINHVQQDVNDFVTTLQAEGLLEPVEL